MRSNGSVAGKGRIIGLPKFHSCGKCTITLTNINSDWMSNASSGLCIILYYADPSIRISYNSNNCCMGIHMVSALLNTSSLLY